MIVVNTLSSLSHTGHHVRFVSVDVANMEPIISGLQLTATLIPIAIIVVVIITIMQNLIFTRICLLYCRR